MSVDRELEAPYTPNYQIEDILKATEAPAQQKKSGGFAGLSPGYAGLFQINVVLPAGVAAGNPDLVIFAGDQPSRVTTLAVRAVP